MCSGRFYRSLPYIYAILSTIEAIIVFSLIYMYTYILVSTISTSTRNNGTVTNTTATTTTPLPLILQQRYTTGIILIALSTMGAFLSGIALWCASSCCCICFFWKRSRRPFLRLLSLNWNCPCYIPRPRWRFSVRISFHAACVTLRIAGIILHGTVISQSSTIRSNILAIAILAIVACSLIIPFLTILLDIYHYRIWWSYEPIVIADPSFTSGPLSSKHKRFIPYVLIEKFRTAARGNQKCKNGSQCQERELEHIVIFHSADFRPQPRWSPEYPIYIGFHRTRANYAMSIAHSDMRISDKPPQMLGFGIYFARSIENTEGKAREDGAYICAEIRMGKVLMITRSEVDRVRNSNTWWSDYDTVYLKHEQEARDEFCVKSPDQVLKWIIYIEDTKDLKLKQYGMNTEFNDTVCACI